MTTRELLLQLMTDEAKEFLNANYDEYSDALLKEKAHDQLMLLIEKTYQTGLSQLVFIDSDVKELTVAQIPEAISFELCSTPNRKYHLVTLDVFESAYFNNTYKNCTEYNFVLDYLKRTLEKEKQDFNEYVYLKQRFQIALIELGFANDSYSADEYTEHYKPKVHTLSEMALDVHKITKDSQAYLFELELKNLGHISKGVKGVAESYSLYRLACIVDTGPGFEQFYIVYNTIPLNYARFLNDLRSKSQ